MENRKKRSAIVRIGVGRTRNEIRKVRKTYIRIGISEYSCIFVVDLITCL